MNDINIKLLQKIPTHFLIHDDLHIILHFLYTILCQHDIHVLFHGPI